MAQTKTKRPDRRKTTIWLWDCDCAHIDAIQSAYGVRSSIEAIRLALAVLAAHPPGKNDRPGLGKLHAPEEVTG